MVNISKKELQRALEFKCSMPIIAVCRSIIVVIYFCASYLKSTVHILHLKLFKKLYCGITAHSHCATATEFHITHVIHLVWIIFEHVTYWICFWYFALCCWLLSGFFIHRWIQSVHIVILQLEHKLSLHSPTQFFWMVPKLFPKNENHSGQKMFNCRKISFLLLVLAERKHSCCASWLGSTSGLISETQAHGNMEASFCFFFEQTHSRLLTLPASDRPGRIYWASVHTVTQYWYWFQ